ncbi:uncharacterized protein LOC128150673 [Harpia harpyja]|uniref:uncharacterized protein LOC128150673 n=1 Tax=Harpia harpyja TaxID=202280 RepID=UPI0022B14187|nr:uncharacterized protein LOC128150673 [Harpia harpyja]
MVGSNVLVPVSLPGPVAHSFCRRKTWRDQSVRPGNPAAMRRLRVLEGCCLCVGLQSRPTHPGGRSRVMGSVPAAGPTVAAVVTSLLERLQDNKGDRVQTYRQLESALQGGDGRLQSGVLNRLIAEASGDIRAAQGVTDDVRTAASDILVALAGSHFHFVMSELQGHLKAMGGSSEEFVFVTLGKLASSYALRCIPFAGMTLLALRAVLSQVGSGRVRRAVCGVLEQWLKGVKTYFHSWDKCPFPRIGEAHICERVYPLYCYVVQNWLGCKEEEDKQAVLRAVAAMIGVLLHEEQHREYAWDQLVLYQDTFWATKVRQCTGPGVAMGSVQVPQGVGELLGARGAREPLLKVQGEQRSPEASFRQEKSNPGGTQVSLGLTSCGGDALPSAWGSGVPEELCPSAQGHVQPCQTQGEVSQVGSHGR